MVPFHCSSIGDCCGARLVPEDTSVSISIVMVSALIPRLASRYAALDRISHKLTVDTDKPLGIACAHRSRACETERPFAKSTIS